MTATRLANAECERMEFRRCHQKRNRCVFEALLLRMKRKPVLRIEPVLVLCRGAAWHREAVVGEHLAGTGDVGEHSVEDASTMPVVIHAQFEEVAQKTACLRNPEGKCAVCSG